MAFYSSTYTRPAFSGTLHRVSNNTELANAINAAKGRNDCIELAPGNYSWPSGNQSGWRGAGPSARMIVHSAEKHKARFAPPSGGYVLKALAWENVILSGVELVSPPGAVWTFGFYFHRTTPPEPSKNVRIQHCRFDGTQNQQAVAVLAGGLDNIEFVDNQVIAGEGEGVYIGRGDGGDNSRNFLIRGNEIWASSRAIGTGGGEAIDVKPPVVNVTVEFNTVRNMVLSHSGAIVCGQNSLSVPIPGGKHNHIIRYNRVHSCTGSSAGAINPNASGGVYVYGNVVWNMGGSLYGIVVSGSGNRGGVIDEPLYIWNNTVASCPSGALVYGGYLGTPTKTNAQFNRVGQTPSGAWPSGSTVTNNRVYATSDFVGPLTGLADAGSGPGSGWRLASGAPNQSGGGTTALFSDPQDLFFVPRVQRSWGGFEVGGAASPPATVAPVASFTRSPTSPTVGQSCQFTDTSTNSPTSWSWNFGDGTTSTTRNPAKTWANAGSYTVTLTASNTAGSSTASAAVLVQTSAPVASFTRSPQSPEVDQSCQFTDTSSNTPTSWSWSFGDGTTSTSQNPTKTWATAGSYTVSLTSSNGAGSSTTSQTVTVVEVASTTTPTLVGTVTASSSGVLTFTIPASATAGRLMVALLGGPTPIEGGTTGTVVPAGWTLLEDWIGSFSYAPHGSVAWKVAGANDAGQSVSFTLPATSGSRRGVLQVWSGVDSSKPINAESESGAAYSATPLAPSVTSTATNAVVVQMLVDQSNRSVTVPAGYTAAGAVPGFIGVYGAYKSAGVGTVAASNWTCSGASNYASYGFVLEPAPTSVDVSVGSSGFAAGFGAVNVGQDDGQQDVTPSSSSFGAGFGSVAVSVAASSVTLVPLMAGSSALYAGDVLLVVPMVVSGGGGSTPGGGGSTPGGGGSTPGGGLPPLDPDGPVTWLYVAPTFATAWLSPYWPEFVRRLLRYITVDVPLTVLKEGGSWRIVFAPTVARLEAAEEYYSGGRVYQVNDFQKAGLEPLGGSFAPIEES